MIMSISGIYSISEEIINATSGMSTGSVNIEIVEYSENSQPFSENGKMVMPGDEIILIPRINNLGDECYIRTKIEYVIDNQIFPVTDYIEGNYISWSKKDGYYYYDSKLPKKDSVELFNKVIIPNLSSDYSGKKVVLHITVDAIQARNFDGNWNNVRIKKSIDRMYDIDYRGESSVIYEDNTNHHIYLDNGFFDKLGNMLPGDSFAENIKLINSSNSKNEYYLSIDYDSLSEKELELLKKIKLLIKNKDNKIIVDSTIADKDKHILGTYRKGEEDNYVIEVSLPKDIDNEFSKIFTKINWKFSYKTVSKVLDGHEENNPLTGDFNINLSIIVFFLSAIGFIIVLFVTKKTNDIE